MEPIKDFSVFAADTNLAAADYTYELVAIEDLLPRILHAEKLIRFLAAVAARPQNSEITENDPAYKKRVLARQLWEWLDDTKKFPVIDPPYFSDKK